MKWKMCVGLLALTIFSNVANAQSCGWTPIPPVNSACGTWQMYQGSQKHTGIQRMKANMSSSRSIKWTYTVGIGISNSVYSSPAIGDINNDGIPEVVFGSRNTRIYALNGTSGTIVWSYLTGGWVTSSPAIGDINNDGIPEVVVGSSNGAVYALRGTDGSLLWSYTTGGSVSSPAIGDINNDGIPEVVVGSSNGAVYALRGTDGSLLWSYTTGGSVSSPAIGDINNDGIRDVVVGSSNGAVYALRGTNGSLLWSYTIGGSVSSPAIGDINNDGFPDVVVGSGDRIIYALRGDNGSLLWFSNPLCSSQSSRDGIKLADIDPSSGLEVIVSTSSGCLYVFSSSGSVLWSMLGIGLMTNSSIGDVDGDGCVEIAGPGYIVTEFFTYYVVRVIDAPGSNCGVVTPIQVIENNKLNYQIEKNGIKLNRAVNYELFSANGRLIKKGYGDFIKIKNKEIYFLRTESEVLKFVID
jgi:outer membrane protein assembly factor BamB